MTRKNNLNRYRHLRAINTQQHSAILACLSTTVVMEQAKRLGMVRGKVMMAESEEEMTLAFDLALYTAREGRSRALDRYARTARLAPGSDESLVLEAMRQARFSIWRIERRHETAGLIVTDVVRQKEAWLVDQNLEASALEGMAMAARLCKPDSFTMTCGVVVPTNRELMDEVMLATLRWRHGDPEHVAQDPRFATATYRAAIDSDIMTNVAYE